MSITSTVFSGLFKEIVTILLIGIPRTASTLKKSILKFLLLKIQSDTVTGIIQIASLEIILASLLFISGFSHIVSELNALHDRVTDIGNSSANTFPRIRNIGSTGNRNTRSTRSTSGTSRSSSGNYFRIKTCGFSVTNLRLKRIIVLVTFCLILFEVGTLISNIRLIQSILIVHQFTLMLSGFTNLFLCSCGGSYTANECTSTRHDSTNITCSRHNLLIIKLVSVIPYYFKFYKVYTRLFAGVFIVKCEGKRDGFRRPFAHLTCKRVGKRHKSTIRGKTGLYLTTGTKCGQIGQKRILKSAEKLLGLNSKTHRIIFDNRIGVTGKHSQ